MVMRWQKLDRSSIVQRLCRRMFGLRLAGQAWCLKSQRRFGRQHRSLIEKLPYFDETEKWIRGSKQIADDIGKVTGVAPIGSPNTYGESFGETSSDMNLQVVGERIALGSNSSRLIEIFYRR